MAATVWNPGWVQEHTQPLAMHAFRMVETQHIAATMRLVDTAAEQDLLEQMLDASKPPLPPEAQGIHYLLAAPFRYLPPTGSRFRSAHMPGIWYGADDPYCACAEIAYWRQRFLLDSAGLITQHLLTDHSLYEAAVQGRAIDLQSPPGPRPKRTGRTPATTPKPRSSAPWCARRATWRGSTTPRSAPQGMRAQPCSTHTA